MKRLALAAILSMMLWGLAEARGPRIGEPAPALKIRGLDGKEVDTARLKGKTLVVYFWTDACGCREQLKEIRTFVNALKGKPFSFLAVNEGQAKPVVDAFLRENGLAYQVLLDEKAAVGRNSFGIKVLPTIFIIDRGGIVREKLIGVVDSRKLEAMIRRYL